jgi:hypothetical protein
MEGRSKTVAPAARKWAREVRWENRANAVINASQGGALSLWLVVLKVPQHAGGGGYSRQGVLRDPQMGRPVPESRRLGRPPQNRSEQIGTSTCCCAAGESCVPGAAAPNLRHGRPHP